MILLKEKADKDLQSHNAEMKELLRIIAHERKLREFMKIKDRELQEDQQLVEWRKKKGAFERATPFNKLNIHKCVSVHRNAGG